MSSVPKKPLKRARSVVNLLAMDTWRLVDAANSAHIRGIVAAAQGVMRQRLHTTARDYHSLLFRIAVIIHLKTNE